MSEKIRTEYGRTAVRKAIATMQDVIDDAKREVDRASKDESTSDIELANRISHLLVWGLANASMGVETCIANAQRQTEMAIISLERRLP
jgi:hypothetical protein